MKYVIFCGDFFLLFNAGRIFITTFWIVNPTWRIPLAWMSYCPKFKMTQDFFFFEVVFLPLSNAFSAVCKSPYRRTTLYSIHSPNRQYNKIKLSFMTSIALLYKHCTSWGQKVSEETGGHPCWKIIPIFFSFFWLNDRKGHLVVIQCTRPLLFLLSKFIYDRRCSTQCSKIEKKM